MSPSNRGWSLLTSAAAALKLALAAFVGCVTWTTAHAQYTTPYSATYIFATSYNGQSFYVGTPFLVNVTMQNTGYVTWTSSQLFRLGSQAPQDNMNWGANRIELPGDVAPGQEANFSFYATAPSTPGWYQMQWRMVSDYCCWFGDLTPSVWIYASGDKAQFVSQSVPAQIYPGSTVPVSVTMKNTGISTWTAGALYRLGSQSPQDNSTWGLGRVELPNDVPPGQNVTFNFSVTAPTSSGNQWFQWRMVNDNNGWFGDFTPQTPVDVSINSAAFVSQSVPGSMQPGHTYPVSVTMQNNGTSTWKTGTNFRLGSQNPEDSGTWGVGRVELPNNVAPGQNVTFAFNVTSPSTPGTYNFQWEMVDDGYQWFGQDSQNVAIPVGYLGPLASFNQTSYDFGTEAYGRPSVNPAVFAVTNTGDQPLTVSSVASNTIDYYISSANDRCTGHTLAAGEQCLIYVQFAPAALGARPGSLTIVSNAPGSPHQLALSGNGIDPSYPSVADSNVGNPTVNDLKATKIASAVASDQGLNPLARATPGTSRGAAIGALVLDDVIKQPTIHVNCSDSGFDCYSGPLGGAFDNPFTRDGGPNNQNAGDSNNQNQSPKDPCATPEQPPSASNEESKSVFALLDEQLRLTSSPQSDIGGNLISAMNEFVLDPINAATGNRYYVQTDYASVGAAPLVALRTYNSEPAAASALITQNFGPGWFSSWDRRVVLSPTASTAYVTRGDGKTYSFVWGGGGNWGSDTMLSTLTSTEDPSGNHIQYKYTTKNGEVDTFDRQGKLISYALQDGRTYAVVYDSAGRLSTVTSPYGRVITYSYDQSGRVASLTDAGGGLTRYTYDDRGRLWKVTYPDNNVREYRYDTNFVYALASVVDESGVTYATFTYDSRNRATGNVFAGGVGSGSVSYGSTDLTSSITTTADGTDWNRTFWTGNDGTVHMASLSPSCVACGSIQSSFSYDANGLLTTFTDPTGQISSATYDVVRGLPTFISEGSGATAKSTTLTWHPTFRKPTQVAVTGGPTTNYQYDSVGRLTQIMVTDGTTSRVTSYQYNAQGLLSSVDGPIVGAADATAFTYDAAGNVATVTNGLGQVFSFTSYDANGRLLAATAPDGTQSTYVYDARGRLISQTVAGQTSSRTYTVTGLLASETDPAGVTTTYTYDGAHRLTDVHRLSERIHYTLDDSGRRTRTDVYDAANVLVYTTSAQYDGLGRLTKQIDANGYATSYTYDANGNLSDVMKPLSNNTYVSTRTYYDASGNPTDIYDPVGAHIIKQYDSSNRLTRVQDGLGNVTSYAFNAYGESASVASPDSGNTMFEYDSAGEISAITDGRPSRQQNAYDGLGRLTQMTFPDQTNISFSYDAGSSAAGKLTMVTASAVAESYSYDANGRLATTGISALGMSKSLSFGRNAIGQVTSMTYPSGKVLTITYANGRPSSLTFDGQPVISDIQYFPYGAPESWIFGHGTEYTRYLDQNKRVSSYLMPNAIRQLTYDSGGRLIRLDESVNGAVSRSRTFDYDVASRLTGFSGFTSAAAAESQSFSYDVNGNRTSRTTNGVTDTYDYVAGSNRISDVRQNGAITSTFGYDAGGNLLSDGVRTFSYNAQDRSSLITAALGSFSNLYGSSGRRVAKTSSGQSVLYVYDPTGNLIGEYSSAGAIREYIWLGSIPVATYEARPPDGDAGLNFVWVDQLYAPRAVTKEISVGNAWAMQVLWTWDSLPFGETPPNENPSGLGAFTLNLRYPGQYFERESGTFQNYFRDYDPSLGRYVQSDPLGLNGGMNLYAYVDANPALMADALGLRGGWTGGGSWGGGTPFFGIPGFGNILPPNAFAVTPPTPAPMPQPDPVPRLVCMHVSCPMPNDHPGSCTLQNPGGNQEPTMSTGPVAQGPDSGLHGCTCTDYGWVSGN